MQFFGSTVFILFLCTSVQALTPLFSKIIDSKVAAWTPFVTKEVKCPQVSGHACCFLKHKDYNNGSDCLLLFGGLLKDRTATSEVWMFDGTEWKNLLTKGSGPGPRMYVTANQLGVDGDIYVIGGWDPESKGSGGSFKDEIYKLNIKSLEWTKCNPLPCGPVSRHTVTTVGDQLIIQTYKEQGSDGQIVVLEADGSCYIQNTIGQGPSGLSMCTAAALDDHTMVIFGGSTKTQTMSENVYLLDTNTWNWSKLENKSSEKDGRVPKPIASSSMVSIDKNTCIVFGGASIGGQGYEGGKGLVGTDETWLLHIDDEKLKAVWTLCNPSSIVRPPSRVAATLNFFPQDSSKLILTGGWNPKTMETYSDNWILEI